MKKGSRRPFFVVLLLAVALLAAVAEAAPGYKSILKKWTRHDEVFAWDNFEARMVWNATYLSDDFRTARRERLASLYEWSASERLRNEAEDLEEGGKYDVFFVSIYAGSSRWSEIGKDSGRWKVVLIPEGRSPVEPVRFERVPVTQREREIYPYIDKWSEAFILKYPKTVRAGDSFRLRMPGIPARSELTWK